MDQSLPFGEVAHDVIVVAFDFPLPLEGEVKLGGLGGRGVELFGGCP